MRNCVTRKEIAEQIGSLTLDFSFFYGNHFIFSGHDGRGNEISMFVNSDVMLYTSPQSRTRIKDYIDIDSRLVKFVIINKDFQTIYQD